MPPPAPSPLPATRLVPGHDIRYTPLDDVVVIMDLRTGRYFLLDEVATAMWNAVLAHGTREAALAALLARFDVDEERLRRDLDAFVDANRTSGFLQSAGEAPVAPPPTPRAGRPPRRLLALRAWWALAATVVGLRRLGFGRWYRNLGAAPVASSVRTVDVARAEAAFLRAENFFILRAAPNDCLARSLSIFRFFTSLGLPARHCIGVRRIPLMMHAWVECQDRVVLDRPDCQDMTVVARLGA